MSGSTAHKTAPQEPPAGKPSALTIWFWAIRPRTLPLAAAAIILGYGLASLYGDASEAVLLLALLTALLLQVLSNLANDYGDGVKGTDGADRLGPLRMVVSGLTSADGMFRAVVLAAGLSLVSGSALLLVAAWGDWPLFFFFIGLGAACVVAAIAYTMGKRPYGYYGLGDFMAWLFFGPVAVMGAAVLCGSPVTAPLWLAGFAAGFCSSSVLNINNMRDIETDRKAGKRSVAVRLGLERARKYHAGMTVCIVLLWGLIWLLVKPAFLWGLFFALPLIRSTWLAVTRAGDAACLNTQLKHTVLSSAFLGCGMTLLLLLV
ncbi:1,4-dihydroxy-2-naphthoate octaprenyltransferase [Desulfovibrio sp. OttesenSCG-928-I05]|nr:1,4-dihydroxy-2-naphthoate octaprenyltransferase [Desulfovibrio sp. OttesenSCG-928-I05]